MNRHSQFLGDAACLRVISPPFHERDRSALMNAAAHGLPSLAAWRSVDPVGLQLDKVPSAPVIRSNFFKASTCSIPKILYHYNVSFYQLKLKDGEFVRDSGSEDIALKNDIMLNTSIVTALFMQLEGHWGDAGLAYDGNSSVFSTEKLSLPCLGNGGPTDAAYGMWTEYARGASYEVALETKGGRHYCLKICYTSEICPPVDEWHGGAAATESTVRDPREGLRALDVAMLGFARKVLFKGTWYLLGNRVFKPDRTFDVRNPSFVGMMGYHASFRACISGLAMVTDISAACFLKGGNLMDFVCMFLRCRESELAHQLNPSNVRAKELEALLKGCKIRLTHITKVRIEQKFRSFGFAANDPESGFEVNDAVKTVEQYFYEAHGLRLRFPQVPTANLGTNKRKVLLPLEHVDIVPGQTRQRHLTGDITAQIIKTAAMRPHERFTQLASENYIFPALEEDYDAQQFGIHSFSSAPGTVPLPMRVKGTILPPAKLLYGGDRVVEPKLQGAWNLAGGIKFAHKAPSPLTDRNGGPFYPFGAIFVHSRLPPHADRGAYLFTVEKLAKEVEVESVTLGIPMLLVDRCKVVNVTNELASALEELKHRGARIVVVVLLEENLYPSVKFLADRLCLPTQCARNSIVTKNPPPRNYAVSLLVKMNMKMGGTNHTLASRAQVNAAGVDSEVFQRPPQSISWLFDEPTMVIGIDVNHSEMRPDGSAQESVVAVVASMDGMLGQYCAHISSCNANREPVSSLYEPFHALLTAFCARNNGQFPRNIIVYRDGVADSQFPSTLSSEHTALREAVDSFNLSDDYGKISFVVCQKRHHTRFFHQSAPHKDYENVCVGLCVDSKGFGPDATNPISAPDAAQLTGSDPIGCIMGGQLNEFYLNSHAPVLGTSKPTKYILLHDEIGLKMSELQLLTFWLTHLYARCTRSVSIVAPAYYAHWAAKRGRVLLTGGRESGLDSHNLKHMSTQWMMDKDTPAMYFI